MNLPIFVLFSVVHGQTVVVAAVRYLDDHKRLLNGALHGDTDIRRRIPSPLYWPVPP
jgi:hypothetical protein